MAEIEAIWRALDGVVLAVMVIADPLKLLVSVDLFVCSGFVFLVFVGVAVFEVAIVCHPLFAIHRSALDGWWWFMGNRQENRRGCLGWRVIGGELVG